jgi:benzoyl-CoA reductase subunit D
VERALALHLERIRRRDLIAVARAAYDTALDAAGLSAGDIDYCATTGEGDLIDWRTGHFYGMTTHARGALFLDPEARGAVDVGALHTRAMKFDVDGRVLGYRMSSQCASGSGQFLENIARYLGVSVDEVGPLSVGSTRPERPSGICAVLAETDVINMVSRGITTPDILRGIHESMAVRLVSLCRAAKIEGVLLMTGGLARDQGLLSALSSLMADGGSKVSVRSHPDSVHAGAIGAALWGAFRHGRLAADGAVTGGAHHVPA